MYATGIQGSFSINLLYTEPDFFFAIRQFGLTGNTVASKV
jgi:hypothetical protein